MRTHALTYYLDIETDWYCWLLGVYVAPNHAAYFYFGPFVLVIERRFRPL
jgi:hypothetical protein